MKARIKRQWAEKCRKAGLITPEKLKKARFAVETFDDTGDAMKVLVKTGAIYNKAVLQLFVTLGGLVAE